MLAYLAGYVGPAWGYVGLVWRLCGPIVRPMSADLEAYVGPCWPMLSQKIRKMGTAKNTVKLMIFWWSAAYLGAMLAYLGAMLAYLEGNMGASWGYVGPTWSYVGPSWGLCWPILGLCWPILGLCWPILKLCWPILRPMLAHVDPSWATCAMFVQKHVECHRAKKHCKLQGVLSTRTPHREVGGRGGGPSLLRRGEKRLLQGHGQGAPGRI